MAMYGGLALALVVVVGIFLVARKQDEAWQQFAGEVGGQYTRAALFRSSRVDIPLGAETITLDTYSVPSGDASSTYTRFRARAQNPCAIQFNIRREGLVARLDKKLGMQDIDSGDAQFDKQFVVSGQPLADVQRLLSSISLRQQLQAQKSVSVVVKGDDLRLEVLNVVRDPERLRALFELTRTVLLELERAS